VKATCLLLRGRVMSNKNDGQKKDAYTHLKHILAVLIVFTAVAGIGFIFARDTVDAQLASLKAQREEQNQERIAQHNQWLAEQRAGHTGSIENTDWPAAQPEGWDILDLSDYSVDAISTQTFTREELETGGLMVVNRWHYLPADYTDERFQNGDELVSVSSTARADGFPIQATNSSVSLMRPAYEALSEMLQAAKNQNLDYYTIQEGYRTNATQNQLFLDAQSKYEDRYTGEVLIEKTRESVSVPGTSDFQTGLSIRVHRSKSGDREFNSANFRETEQFTWLYDHSWEHGYTFRFPIAGYPTENTADKSWKTGIGIQMMVFRYVGKGPAAVMHVKDFCLEEFVEFMIEHPHIGVFNNGELLYELYRVTDSGSSMNVDVTDCDTVTASIDNVGGVIVCLAY